MRQLQRGSWTSSPKAAASPGPTTGLTSARVRAAGNRPQYHHLLGTDWLPSIPDVDARLRSDPPARVDLRGLRRGLVDDRASHGPIPGVCVDGIDLDDPAIAQARRNLATTEVGEQVAFHAARRGRAGPSRVATTWSPVFEAVHDMSQPVTVSQRTARQLLAPGGHARSSSTSACAETFTAPGRRRSSA